MSTNGFLPKKGKYKSLLSYQKSAIIYDCTYAFCQRFLNKLDRTIDQMIQAARSGKQNIIEGAKAAVTSTETELKLTNVARASLEELLEDYHDFLRVRDLNLWEKDSERAVYIRNLSSGKVEVPGGNGRYGPPGPNGMGLVAQEGPSHKAHGAHNSHEISPIHGTILGFVRTRESDVCANIMICLINQCNYLLDRQIRKLEHDFLENGGLRETMYKARMRERNGR